MPIKRTSIENLKSRVNIVDVVGKYTQLKKRGKSFVGLSPFTNEKTPSFTVDPIKNVYYCFSSNKGGDIISFVQEMEKMEFYEAVEALSERFAVPLEYEEGSNGAPKLDRSLKKELQEIHLYAAEFFQKAFAANHPEADAVRKYWTNERKFSLEVAKDFGVGYAPTDPYKLLEQLVKKGFSEEALKQSGLYFYFKNNSRFSSFGSPVNPKSLVEDPEQARASEQSKGFDKNKGYSTPVNSAGFKPRFRGRLMIPLRDVQGNVIAFTGRKLPQTPADDPAFEAKYVNSPETPLFKKGGMLFNFDRARTAVDAQGFFLMVEGQLDAIRVSSSGYPAVIAPQGTAITPEQLTLIKRYEAKLRVFLDGDRAGQAAALRMLPMALAAELDVSFIKLPAGVDPDAHFRENASKGLKGLDMLSPMQFAVQALLPEVDKEGDKISAQAKSTALQAIFEIIAAAASSITHEAFLDELLRLQHLEPRSVRLEFEKYLRNKAIDTASHKAYAAGNNAGNQADGRQGNNQNKGNNKGNNIENEASITSENDDDKKNFNKNLTTAEFELLLLVVHHPELAPRIAGILETEWLDADNPYATLLNLVLAEALEGLWEPPASFEQISGNDATIRNLFYSLLARELPKTDALTIANNSLRAIYTKYVSRSLDAMRKELSGACEPAKQAELLKKQQFLLNSLKKITFLPNG